MYKNIVPLPEVSEDPPVGPQINTGSEIGVREGVYVCVCEVLFRRVSRCLVSWVHHSAHEQDGS